MCELSARLDMHHPRTKFLDVQKANLTYIKQRRRNKSRTRRKNEKAEGLLTEMEKNSLDIITTMCSQQKKHFQSGDS